MLPAPRTFGVAASAPERGDGRRFTTWAGYEVGRFPEAVAVGDWNDDGAVDVAYARSDFFDQGMTVQLNLGDGTMGARVSYPAVEESSDVKAGDLDGDADLDLVVVSQGSNLVNDVIDVYVNDGHGRFAHRTELGGEGPQKMALADLDGDGDLDLATSSGLFSTSMSVLLNDGNGAFGPARRYEVGQYPKGIAAADLDGDGDVDLAIARDDPTTLTTRVGLWRNDGTAVFALAREIVAVETGDPSLAVGDFDADGQADLVMGLVGTDRHVVMLNRGGLSFTQASYRAGFSAWDVATGDVEPDGDVDVVLATLGSSSTGDMSILRNRGDGTFVAARFMAGDNPHDAAVADLDGDGRSDIVVANGNTTTGGIHLQRAGDKFGPPPLYRTALPVGSVEHSDVDHDGDLDLAVSINDPFGGVGYVQVMENDGTGGLRPGQLLDAGLTSSGSVGHVQPADLNGDGWDDLVWTINQFNRPVAPIVYALNDGAGRFGAGRLHVGTDGNAYVSTADLDGDGDQDLVASQFTARVAVYLNRGDATFGQAGIVRVAEFPTMAIARDLSGDGVPDLAVTHNGAYGSSKAISVVLGTGGGHFGGFTKTQVGQGPLEIVAVDLDRDGDLDLATANTGGDDISNFKDETTTVLLNDGDGSFGTVTTYPGEAINYYLSESAIAAADVDGDGNADLVVSNVIGNDVGVYYGNGDGTVDAPQVRYGVHNGAGDFTVADLNGDSRPDVAAAGYLQSVDPLFPPTGIVVLRNRGT